MGSIIVAFPGFCVHQMGAGRPHPLWHAGKAVLAQLCLTGVLSTIAQLSKTAGLKCSKSFGVLTMRYLDIFFGELDWVVLCGMSGTCYIYARDNLT